MNCHLVRASLAVVAVALVLGAACAHRTPPRLPGSAPAASAITTTALALQGRPYKNGGADPSGFDCSGLVQYVFAAHGIALPRSVREQYQVGVAVKRNEILPGDLVFFATTSRDASHVGIVIGDDTFVHAPSSRGVVRVEHLSAQYWATRYVGARRIRVQPRPRR